MAEEEALLPSASLMSSQDNRPLVPAQPADAAGGGGGCCKKLIVLILIPVWFPLVLVFLILVVVYILLLCFLCGPCLRCKARRQPACVAAAMRPGAPPTIFKFFFSPPARLVHVSALLCKVPGVQFVEVELYKGDQLQWWFQCVNPSHQVPAMIDGGRCMAESRDLVRHIFNKHGRDNPEVAHWYPADPDKRASIDAWMDWSKPLHLCIEGQIAFRLLKAKGLPWRENFGSIGLLIPRPGGDKTSMAKLKGHLDEAERLVGERSIQRLEDLNVGDLTTLQEVSMAFECFEGVEDGGEGEGEGKESGAGWHMTWRHYPNLRRVYDILHREVPEFKEVHAPFVAFMEKYRGLRDSNGLAETACGYAAGALTSIKFILWVILNQVQYRLAPAPSSN